MIIDCWGEPFNTDDAADFTRFLAFLDAHPNVQKRNDEYMMNHLIFMFASSKSLHAAQQMKSEIILKHVRHIFLPNLSTQKDVQKAIL